MGGVGWTAGALRRRTNTRVSSSLATRITPPSMAADVLILIPARMASTRLPRNPLADIAGLPMIVEALRRAQDAKLGRGVVACDDEVIAAAVEKAGAQAIMTRADHPSGSDRIFEALNVVD